MKIAALTMVYRDHWALSQWYAHHAAALGADALYVVAHGPDPAIADLCPGASILTIPRDRFDGFDRARGQMLDGIAAGLLNAYDWVIRTDADELICWDPARYDSLRHVVETNADAPVLTGLGFDLVDTEGTPPDAPWHRARDAAFSGHYSKAIASRRAIPFQLHGVRVADRRLDGFPFRMPRGLYLAHLKYANRAALEQANAVRMAVGGQNAPGGPGEGWRAADADAQGFLQDFTAKPVKPWPDAQAEAFDRLSHDPKRDPKRNIVKARALKFNSRTNLPDWFGRLG